MPLDCAAWIGPFGSPTSSRSPCPVWSSSGGTSCRPCCGGGSFKTSGARPFQRVRLFGCLWSRIWGDTCRGKVWQIAGLAYMAKGEGISASVATGAAVLGQGVALLAATLIGVGALFGPNELWRVLGWPGSAVGLGLAVGIIGVVSTPRLFQRIVAGWFRLTRSELPQELSQGRNFGLRWLVLYILNWGIYCVAFWLLYLSFGEWRTFMQLGPAFAAAYVAGYLAVFAPAGAGIREGFLVVLLQPVMAREAAVVFAVIARLWTTTLELIPALILSVWREPSGRQNR